MARTELEQFLLERLQDLDPTIDTSAASAAWNKVVAPTISRLGEDLLSGPTRDFITARIAREYPDIDMTGAGSPWADTFGDPMQLLLDSVKVEINAIKNASSLADPDLLTEAEADRLVANVMDTRRGGALSIRDFRLYFNNATAISFDGEMYVEVGGLLRYFVQYYTEITSEQMQLQQEDGRYYVDVRCQAELASSDYNIAVGTKGAMLGVPAVVEASVIRAPSEGVSRETNRQFIARVRASLGEKAPNTEPAIRKLLLESFEEILDVIAVGYGDPEMVRDVITGTVSVDEEALGLGPVLDEFVPLSQFLAGVNTIYTDNMTADFVNRIRVTGVPAKDFVAEGLISVGDVCHCNGADHIIESFIGQYLTVRDSTCLFDGSTTGSRYNYSVPRGSDLNVTNTYRGLDASGVAVAAAGTYLIHDDGTGAPEYKIANAKVIDHHSSATDMVINKPISVRKFGVGSSQFGWTPPVAYVNFSQSVTFSLATWILGTTLGFYDSTGAQVGTGDVAWNPAIGGYASGNVLGLENLTGTAPAFGHVIKDTGALVGEGVILDPAETSGVRYQPTIPGPPTTTLGTLQLDSAAGVSPYTFTDHVTGAPARVGDYVAVRIAVAPGTIYGMYEILNVTPYTLTIDSASPYVWPTVGPPPTSTAYTLAWTIIDGQDVSLQDYFETEFVSENWSIWEFADYVEDPYTYNFIQFVPYYHYDVRSFVSADDALLSAALTISDIPGGIQTPNTIYGEIEINDDEVHVGGMTDVYVKPVNRSTNSFNLDTLSDGTPLLEGTDLTWTGGNRLVNSALFPALELPNATAGGSLTLVITEGEYAGSYVVTTKDVPLASSSLGIDTVLTNANLTGAEFYLTYEINMNLDSPKESRISEATNLITGLTRYVRAGTGSPYVDFGASGVAPGDTLDILDGADKGTYTIQSVADNGYALELNTSLTWVGTGLPYSIYRELSAVPRPFTRLTELRLLEADGADTGLTIPKKNPVDIRSYGSFSNSGVGLKLPNTVDLDVTGTVTVLGDTFTDTSVDFVAVGVVPGDLLFIEDGVNQGSYVIDAVTNTTVDIKGDGGLGRLAADSARAYQVGAASTGTVRLYFEEPTGAYAFGSDSGGEETLFTDESGHSFRPDLYATLKMHSFPADETDLETDLLTPTDLTSAGVYDFLTKGLDEAYVHISTCLLEADNGLIAEEANVSGSRLALTIGSAALKTLVFEGTNPVALDSSGYPGGVKQQLEAAFPEIQLTVRDAGGPGPYYVQLVSDSEFTISYGSALTPLGFASSSYTNVHPEQGYYGVTTFDSLSMTLETRDSPPVAANFSTQKNVTAATYKDATQGLTSYEMAAQQDETGLYYFDVDVMSVYPGNENNLTDSVELSVTDLISYGYELQSRNEALTFSDEEEVDLAVTAMIQDPLVEEAYPAAATTAGRRVQITAETAPSVSSAQQVLRMRQHRVVNNNPLAKHFQPAYVRFLASFTGTRSAAYVKQQVVESITDMLASDELSGFSVVKTMNELGVDTLETPIELVAVVHQMDRSIRTTRTEGSLNQDRTVLPIAEEDWIVITRG